MATNVNFPADSTARDDNLNSAFIDARNAFEHIRQQTGLMQTAAVGLVVAIGSSGLLLGGVTVAISSSFVAAGFGLLSAMTLGFFITGTVGTVIGLLLAVRAIRVITERLASDTEERPSSRQVRDTHLNYD